MSGFRVGSGTSPEVAVHLQEAGSAADPLEAAEWSLRAAQEASAVYAWDEAIQHADAAVDLLQGNASDERLAEVAVVAANLRLRSSRGFDQAVTLLETALRRYLAAGMDSAAGTVHSRIGGALSLHHSVMDIPRALEHFEAAERLLGDSERAFYVNRGRSQAAMFGLRTDVLGTAADKAAAIAAEVGRRDLAVFAGWAQAWAAVNEGRLTDAAELLERSWATAHELSDPYLGWAPVNAAALVANAYLLDPGTARRWCRRGLGQPRFTSLAHSHDTVIDQLALALAATGDLAAAREVLSSLRPDAVARRMMTFLDGDWEQARDAWAGAVAADEAAGDLHDAALNSRVARRCQTRPGRPGRSDGRVGAGPRSGPPRATGADRARRACGAGPAHRSRRPGRGRSPPATAATRSSPPVRTGAGRPGGSSWPGPRSPRHEVTTSGPTPTRPAPSRCSPPSACPGIARMPCGRWARFLARRGQDERADERRRQADQVYREIGAADRWRRPGGHS